MSSKRIANGTRLSSDGTFASITKTKAMIPTTDREEMGENWDIDSVLMKISLD
jgi:hypothetical protein